MSFFIGKWYFDGENTTLAKRTLQGNITTMQLHDISCIMQPDTKSFNVVPIAGGHPVKLLKNLSLVLTGNTKAFVRKHLSGAIGHRLSCSP
jgi:hypothetical protein